MSMKTSQPLELWGIYHLDREYAHSLGDPLLTVVEAPSKLAAEQEEIKLADDLFLTACQEADRLEAKDAKTKSTPR